MTTNAVYEKSGSTFTFKSSGASAAFTPTSLGAGSGWSSVRCDLGALPRPTMFRWYAQTKWAATPTVGVLLRQYLAWWSDDSTPGQPDGDLANSDATFTVENDLKNLKPIPPIICDNAGTGLMARSGMVYIPVRYVSLVWWNAAAVALSSTASDHLFQLIPIYPDIQAAA